MIPRLRRVRGPPWEMVRNGLCAPMADTKAGRGKQGSDVTASSRREGQTRGAGGSGKGAVISMAMHGITEEKRHEFLEKSEPGGVGWQLVSTRRRTCSPRDSQAPTSAPKRTMFFLRNRPLQGRMGREQGEGKMRSVWDMWCSRS